MMDIAANRNNLNIHNNDHSPITVNQILGAIYIFLFAYLIALFAFIFEIILVIFNKFIL